MTIRSIRECILRFVRDDSGPTAVEYCVMLMLILLVVITAIQAIGDFLNASFQNSADELAT